MNKLDAEEKEILEAFEAGKLKKSKNLTVQRKSRGLAPELDSVTGVCPSRYY